MFSCEIQRNKLEPVSITFQREVGIFSHHENGRITVDKSLCLTYYPKLLSENDEESEVEWLKNSQVKEDNLLDEQFRLQRGFGDLVEWKDGDQTLNDIFTFLSIKFPHQFKVALDGIKWVCRRFTLKNLGKFAYGNTVNGTCHLYCYKLTGVNFLCGGGITFKGEANKHSSLGAFAGYKFEQIMTSNNPKELEKPINRHCAFYRLVHTNIGNKPVLLSAEMDCQDSEGNYLELKLVRENEDFNRFHSKLRDTVIQCQLAGVERIVLGKYRWLQKQQPQLISTKEIDTKQVEEAHFPSTAMASALLDLIEKILTEKAEGHVCHILLGPVKNEDENLHVKYQWLTSLESAKFLPQIQV